MQEAPLDRTTTSPPRPRRTNVILTGFMGTGKTTVGAIVADRLGFELVDTDATIERRHGPIATVFAEHGEPAFRAMERVVAAELAGREGLVVSTGGAMLVDPVNAETLSATGTIVCLVASTDEILRRVLGDPGAAARPLLAVDDPRQRVVELLAARAEAYARFPQVDTDGLTPDAVADAVVTLLRGSGPSS